MVSAASMHISASAAIDGAPTVSASNCMNWRKRPGPGFSLRNTQPIAVRAVGQREILEILGNVARERRGQVIPQREPLLVVVLEREHAFVRPVLVGQELAERVGIFDRRRLNRLEAVALEDHTDRFHHVPGGGDLGRSAVGEAARQAGFELWSAWPSAICANRQLPRGSSRFPLCHYRRKRISLAR